MSPGAPVPAHLAYIDPGTGSFLLQMLLGGLLAAGFLIRTFWARITTFFGGILSRRPKPPKPE